MQFLEQTKRWLGEITEIALLLIALGVAVEILFGGNTTVPFFGGVVGNIMQLLRELGDNGLVGLIVLGVIVFLFQRRRAVA